MATTTKESSAAKESRTAKEHRTEESSSTLNDLFMHELQDIYDAEKQLVRALPKLAKAASNPALKTGLEQHLEETKNQVTRLEQVFETMNAKAQSKPCKGMKGLLEEGEESISRESDPDIIDAILIAACQKVEHYEIATYGTLCAWAKTQNMEEAQSLLHETLEEEKSADEKLTKVAESKVNKKAA